MIVLNNMNIDEIHNNTVLYIEQNLKPIIVKIGEPLEGNLFCENNFDTFLPKRKNIIVSCQNRKKALEIGFNSGYSAVLILLSNPTIKLTCVDIAFHRYTIPCYEKLKQDFGDRIELLIGDSRNVVPNIIDKFDFVHIDGCHHLDVAECDIINTNKLLMDNAVIIMDDVNINNNKCTLTQLWNSYTHQFGYKEPPFEIYKNNYADVRVKS